MEAVDPGWRNKQNDIELSAALERGEEEYRVAEGNLSIFHALCYPPSANGEAPPVPAGNIFKFHRMGVQPHVVLLALDRALKVIAVSSNCGEWLGRSPQQALGRVAADLFDQGMDKMLDVVQSLRRSEDSGKEHRLPLTLVTPLMLRSTSGVLLKGLLNKSGKYFTLELERSEDMQGEFEVYNTLKDLAAQLQAQPRGVKAICNVVVGVVRQVLNIDRVIIYKFTEEEHGEVLAESLLDPDFMSLNGLHFPATDVPWAVRELLLARRLRWIHDVDSKPVPLVHDGSFDGSPIKHAHFVECHPCHLQYLKNMGLNSSGSLGIVLPHAPRKLWGIIACHELHTAKPPSFAKLVTATIICEVFCSYLAQALHTEAHLREVRVVRIQALLLEQLQLTIGREFSHWGSDMMDMVGADGVALMLSGSLLTMGVHPSHEQICHLVHWLTQNRLPCGESYSKDEVPPVVEVSLRKIGYKGLDNVDVCGVLLLLLDDGDFVIWFRKESACIVQWPAAADQAARKQFQKLFNPYHSFALLSSIQEHCSKPWSASDISIGQNFREVLQDSVTNRKARSLLRWEAKVKHNLGRVKMINQLEQMVGNLRKVVTSSHTSIVCVNTSFIITEWNENMEAATGYTQDEALGSNLVTTFVAPAFQQIVTQSILQAACGQISENGIEIVLKGKNSMSIDMVAMFSQHISPDGIASAIYVVCNNITARKEVEREMQLTRAQLQDSINLLDAGVAIFDENMVLVICNPKFRQLFHVPPSSHSPAHYRSILAHACEEGAHVSSGLPQDQWIERVMEAGKDPNASQKILVNNQWIAVSYAQANNGGAVCMYSDLTRAMEEERLRLAKEAAEASSNAKSDFLATMSHEIRTPMNSVLGYGMLLQDTDLTMEQGEYVDCILSSGKMLLTLISDVLDLSKIESAACGIIHAVDVYDALSATILSSGMMRVEQTEFNLGTELENMVELLIPKAKEKSLHLHCNIHPDVPLLLCGDVVKLRQVLLNLMGNAVKFTSSGSVSVSVSVIPNTATQQEPAATPDTTPQSSGPPPPPPPAHQGPLSPHQSGSTTSPKLQPDGVPIRQDMALAQLPDGEPPQPVSADKAPLPRRPRLSIDVGSPTSPMDIDKKGAEEGVQGDEQAGEECQRGEQADDVAGGSSAANMVTLHFEVRDTGIGISEEDAPKLFQRFTQADTSTTRKYGGTGLGLVICRKLLQLMSPSNKVDVRSKPGEGSCFWFNVSIMAQETLAPPARDASSPPPPRAVFLSDGTDHLTGLDFNLQRLGFATEVVPMPELDWCGFDNNKRSDVALLVLPSEAYRGMLADGTLQKAPLAAATTGIFSSQSLTAPAQKPVAPPADKGAHAAGEAGPSGSEPDGSEPNRACVGTSCLEPICVGPDGLAPMNGHAAAIMVPGLVFSGPKRSSQPVPGSNEAPLAPTGPSSTMKGPGSTDGPDGPNGPLPESSNGCPTGNVGVHCVPSGTGLGAQKPSSSAPSPRLLVVRDIIEQCTSAPSSAPQAFHLSHHPASNSIVPASAPGLLLPASLVTLPMRLTALWALLETSLPAHLLARLVDPASVQRAPSAGAGALHSVSPRRQIDAPGGIAAPPCSPLSPFSLASAEGRRCRALLAEDNPVNQRLFVKFLSTMGCDVVVVENGQQAVDKVLDLSSQFDICFMDCQMPTLDGLEATKIIRREEAEAERAGRKPRRLPIVAVTANAFVEDRERCMACGMDDYITKPVMKASIMEILDRWASAVE